MVGQLCPHGIAHEPEAWLYIIKWLGTTTPQALIACGCLNLVGGTGFGTGAENPLRTFLDLLIFVQLQPPNANIDRMILLIVLVSVWVPAFGAPVSLPAKKTLRGPLANSTYFSSNNTRSRTLGQSKSDQFQTQRRDSETRETL